MTVHVHGVQIQSGEENACGGDDVREHSDEVERALSAHRAARNQHLTREVVFSRHIFVCAESRHKVLEASLRASVPLRAVDVERGVARVYALGDKGKTADHIILFTNARARAVEGDNEGSFVAVVGVGLGQTDNALALVEFLAVRDLVCARAAYVTEIVEFYREIYVGERLSRQYKYYCVQQSDNTAG